MGCFSLKANYTMYKTQHFGGENEKKLTDRS